MNRWLLVLAFSLICATAQASVRDDAMDKVYEAADAIDAARAEQEAGREGEATRLLAAAEGYLATARALDPTLPRIGYELARVHLARDQRDKAVDALLPAMRLEMPLAQHLAMAEMFDGIRATQGKPSLGVAWTRASQMRGVGLVTLASGLAVTAIGLAVSYGSFADAASKGVTDDLLDINRGGWALAGIGGGVALAGTGLTIAGQIQVGQLEGILPGPWRLPRDRPRADDAYLGFQIRGPLPSSRR